MAFKGQKRVSPSILTVELGIRVVEGRVRFRSNPSEIKKKIHSKSKKMSISTNSLMLEFILEKNCILVPQIKLH